MPNSLQTLDTSFPKIDNHQTTEENFAQVTNYLYMLLENLKYTLGNLGEENFNDTAMEDMVKMIREPIWARIEDAEGNINTLNITAKSLSSQISDINGNVSSLTQTSQILISRIGTAEGNISTLTQTAQSLSSEIKAVDTGVGTKITQTLKGISLSATDGGGNSSTLKLLSNGAEIASTSIQFKGLVTFTDLSTTSGNTTIHGGNLKSGTVVADFIKGKSVSVLSASGSTVATIGTEYSNRYGLTFGCNYPIRLEAKSNLYLENKFTHPTTGKETTTTLQLYSDDFPGAISTGCTAFLGSGTGTNLGAEGRKWNNIYANTGPWSTSDQREKHSIEELPEKYLDLFDNLAPRRFKLDEGTSGRFHVGFIAQEVEDAMALAGVSPEEFAGFGVGYSSDGSQSYYMLRYEEFIAILAAKIKRLEERMS